jgi:hypothetical protein
MDCAPYGFYLRLCLQLISLELLELPRLPQVLSRFLSRRSGSLGRQHVNEVSGGPP